MAAATLTAIGLGISALSAGYGIHESTMAKKHAKGVASAENDRIEKASKEALTKRKDLIDNQRRQIGADSDYKTSGMGIQNINQGLLG